MTDEGWPQYLFALFRTVAATILRFSREVVALLADALKFQGWTVIIARPGFLRFTMGMVRIVIRTALWVRYRPVALLTLFISIIKGDRYTSLQRCSAHGQYQTGGE